MRNCQPPPTTTGKGRVLSARRGTLATAVVVSHQPPCPAAVQYGRGRHLAR